MRTRSSAKHPAELPQRGRQPGLQAPQRLARLHSGWLAVVALLVLADTLLVAQALGGYSRPALIEQLTSISLYANAALLALTLVNATFIVRPALRVIERQIKALEENEARAVAITDNMLNGVIVVDARGRIRSINQSAERMFGYTRAELVGSPLAQLVPPSLSGGDPSEFLRRVHAKALNNVTEWEGLRRDGSVFPFELAMSAVRLPDGMGFIGSLRDISERREIERLKAEFVSTVSHELRTPLTSIRGSLTLLAHGALGKLDKDALEVVQIAERNTLRLIDLVNEILDLEKLESSEVELAVSTLRTAEVVRRAFEAVRGFADQEGVSFVADVDVPEIDADPDRIIQVLVNLLSNAVKFSPRGSTVTLRAARRGDIVELKVIDAGRGIPKDAIGFIFDRFRQVEANDARRRGGTGLGLAICKAIVERHGGAIAVESEVGVGSTFTVALPAHAGQPDAVIALPAAAAPRPLTDADAVVLVDDDAAFATVMARQLRELGIRTHVAFTGREANHLLCAHRPRLLVLDVGLPDTDGFQIVEGLRRDARFSTLPLLVFSGREFDHGERARLCLGPTRFLTKSRASDAEFCRVVHGLLTQPGAAERVS